MPRLANSGHEAFVQAYVVNGGNGGQAYRTAYPKRKTNRAAEVNGSRLLRNAEVLARVAELQNKGAERASITLHGLIREAGEIQAQAVKNNQMAAAISALIAKAKLAGLWVDHSESRNTNVVYEISDEPPDEKNGQGVTSASTESWVWRPQPGPQKALIDCGLAGSSFLVHHIQGPGLRATPQLWINPSRTHQSGRSAARYTALCA